MNKIIITKVGAHEIEEKTTAITRTSSICYQIPIGY